jgi:hypothetical protein
MFAFNMKVTTSDEFYQKLALFGFNSFIQSLLF